MTEPMGCRYVGDCFYPACSCQWGRSVDAPAAAATTFTPGPWQIEGRRGAGYIISAGMNAERDGPASYVGVLAPMFHIAGEELAANARLAAAAPALLEALQAVSDMLMGRPDIVAKLHPLMGFAEKATFEKASAALLQATGGENGR